MIKNIIFDMGNVLKGFDPQYFIRKLGIDGEDAVLLYRHVFHSLEWARMDRGSLTDAEAVTRMCQHIPQRLHWAVEQLVCHWDEPILPMEGMEALVAELSAAGYGLYLLSNASLRQREYWPRVPGSEYFQATFISSEHKLVKPQPEIYREMLDTFQLNPEECVFIDDSPANIEGAFFCGIPGIVFHGGAKELRRELAAMGVRISV